MANVLGINVSELPEIQVLEKINGFLRDGRQHYLVTPNPEIILHSHHDEELFYILNKADIAIADGFGLKLAGLISRTKIPRVTGADLTLDLLRLATDKKIKVAVLNWRGGLSQRRDLEEALRKNYPSLDFLVLDSSRSHPLEADIIKRLNEFAPALLFNTFGSPYQEKVIYHNLKKIPSVSLALGVGGAFDFLTGRAVRAAKIFRHLGLEWLWRLMRQPSRWKRIYRATVVFTVKLIQEYFRQWRYRSNVVIWLYKKDGDRYQVVIVDREDTPGHWQLPQGGTDGESLAVAGAREAREELNTNKFKSKAVFKNTYSYLFPPIAEQGGRPLNKFYYGYKGQKQGLYIAEFTGSDEDIKVNFWDHRAWKWVADHDLPLSVEPVRQASARIFLEKFKSLKL